MWKAWGIFILGFIVMVVPFAGFPVVTDRVLFLFIGLGLLVLSFLTLRDMYFLTTTKEDRVRRLSYDRGHLERQVEQSEEPSEEHAPGENL